MKPEDSLTEIKSDCENALCDGTGLNCLDLLAHLLPYANHKEDCMYPLGECDCGFTEFEAFAAVFFDHGEKRGAMEA